MIDRYGQQTKPTTHGAMTSTRNDYTGGGSFSTLKRVFEDLRKLPGLYEAIVEEQEDPDNEAISQANLIENRLISSRIADEEADADALKKKKRIKDDELLFNLSTVTPREHAAFVKLSSFLQSTDYTPSN